MATHLVKILSKNGTLEFPAPLAQLFSGQCLCGTHSVSVAHTQCLCGKPTVVLWQTHSEDVWAAGGREVRVKV